MALSLPSVVFGPAARPELIEARDCYSARDAELADCFIAEVDNVFERVATAPPAFSRGLQRRPPRTAAAQLDAISGRGTPRVSTSQLVQLLHASLPLVSLAVQVSLSPEWLPDLAVHDIRLGKHKLDIRFWREDEETALEVIKGDPSW